MSSLPKTIYLYPGRARMGNPETEATLCYDIVQRQANERNEKNT
jgi:hypothetical protein